MKCFRNLLATPHQYQPTRTHLVHSHSQMGRDTGKPSTGRVRGFNPGDCGRKRLEGRMTVLAVLLAVRLLDGSWSYREAL